MTATAARQTLRAVTRQGETLTYAAITGIGAFAAVYGRQYGMTTEEGEVGPGMVPVIAGALLFLLGLVLLMQGIRAGAHETATSGQSAEADETDVLGRTDSERVRHLWIVFGLLFLTINLVGVLGLVACFGLFVLVVFVVVERRPLLASVAIAACACAFIQVVFGTFLRVPLPEGLFGS